MTSYVSSRDGTRIGLDRLGGGPPVVIVNGILFDRRSTRPLAEALARHFTVMHYDRRGRGDSGDTAPYALDRELEDLAAVIDAAGGRASVYGHSSGAALALNAAARGLPIDRLALHEPPYGAGDEASTRAARQLAASVLASLAEGRRAQAIATFMSAAGVPDEMVAEFLEDPRLLAAAPTMAYDCEVMGELRDGGTLPVELVRAIRVPTLVLAGGASPEFFRETATRIAGLLADGRYQVLDGQVHGAPADVVAPAVAAFFTAG